MYGIPVRIDTLVFVFAFKRCVIAANSSRERPPRAGARRRRDGLGCRHHHTSSFSSPFSATNSQSRSSGAPRDRDREECCTLRRPRALRREPDNPRAEFRIAVAGPVSSFIFALIAFGAMSLAATGGYRTVAASCFIVGWGNLLIAVFNLMPGYPLDGGRVLRALLWHRSGQFEEATRTASLGGQVIAWTLIVFGLYVAFVWQDRFMALWSVLVGIFARCRVRCCRELRGGKKSGRTCRRMDGAGRHRTRYARHHSSTPFCAHRQRRCRGAARRLHVILTLEDLKSLPRDRASHRVWM